MENDRTGSIERLTTDRMLDFFNHTPTPYHLVETMREKFEVAGFKRLDPAQIWQLRAKGKYYLVRSGTSIAAFVLGDRPLVETGFRIIAAHTDFPGLRLKPNPLTNSGPYQCLGVEVYGKPILVSYFDRELFLGGSIVVEDDRGFSTNLVSFDDQRLIIPQLAVHFHRDVNDEGMKINPQTMLPVFFSAGRKDGDYLKKSIAERLKVGSEQIRSFDLHLCDLRPSCYTGIDGECISARAIDNKEMCFAGLEALLSTESSAPAVLVCFDNEEVGSRTHRGADGTFFRDVLERVSICSGGTTEDFHRTLAGSFVISADGAHALHPNYLALHDSQHMPVLNGGPVLKVNSQQKYMTDFETQARFEQLCRVAAVPFQRFVMRSDLPCGSTVGPAIAARTGIPVVDVGNCMLAMHSIRETTGTDDLKRMIKVMETFYKRSTL